MEGTAPLALPAASAAPRIPRVRVVVWLAVLGILAVAAVFISAGYSGALCSGCHAMRPFADSLRASRHSGTGCTRCHGSGFADYAALGGREAADMLPAFAFSLGSAEPTGPSNAVPDAACLSCHADVLGRTVSAHGMRMRHASCVPQGQGCVECHSGVAHGKSTRAATGVSMDACVKCHNGGKVSARCDLCHAAKLQTERIARGVWAVTHGPDWQRMHGLGNLADCRICHPSDYCKQCHGMSLPHPDSFPRTHGETALTQRAQCLKCHDEKAFCLACHGIPMPHPAGFLPAHSKVAKGFDDPACARCHPRDTCDACHLKHTHPGSTRGTIGGSGSRLPKVGS